jgi:hypothetical protein
MDWFPITFVEAFDVAITVAAVLSVFAVGWYFWGQD